MECHRCDSPGIQNRNITIQFLWLIMLIRRAEIKMCIALTETFPSYNKQRNQISGKAVGGKCVTLSGIL